MSYEDKSGTENQEYEVPKLGRPGKTYTTGYIITDPSKILDPYNSLFATFDRGLAEEMVLTYAYEWLYNRWYCVVHGEDSIDTGFVSAIYQEKLDYAPIEIKEIKWYG